MSTDSEKLHDAGLSDNVFDRLENLEQEAAKNFRNSVKKAVENGSSASTLGKLLNYAAIYGYLDLVQYLIENGVNVDPSVEEYSTDALLATQSALEQGNHEIVDYLVRCGGTTH